MKFYREYYSRYLDAFISATGPWGIGAKIHWAMWYLGMDIVIGPLHVSVYMDSSGAKWEVGE